MEEIYSFAGNPLDRASERRRDTEWVRSLFDDPAARVLPLRDLRPLTRERTGGPALDWQRVGPWREVIERGATLIFLGLGDEGPRFAVDATGANIGPAGDGGGVRRAHAGAAAAGRRGGDRRRGALADRLARAAPILRPMRLADPGRIGRLGAALPGMPRVAFPAHRSGRDHAVGARRVRAARAATGGAPATASRAWPASWSRARRWRRRCAARPSRKPGSGSAGCSYLACQPWPFPSSLMTGFVCEALTEEITVDPEETGRGALVLAGRDPRDGRARRERTRRPDAGFAAGPGGDRAPHLPPLVARAGRHLTISPDDPVRPERGRRGRRPDDDALSNNRIFRRWRTDSRQRAECFLRQGSERER